MPSVIVRLSKLIGKDSSISLREAESESGPMLESLGGRAINVHLALHRNRDFLVGIARRAAGARVWGCAGFPAEGSGV